MWDRKKGRGTSDGLILTISAFIASQAIVAMLVGALFPLIYRLSDGATSETPGHVRLLAAIGTARTVWLVLALSAVPPTAWYVRKSLHKRS